MSARQLPTGAVSLLLRQLADGLDAGLSEAEALAVVLRDSSAALQCPGLVEALTEVAAGDTSWALALQRFPRNFTAETVALVAHGEQHGELGATLLFLADDFEESAAMRRSLRVALGWPLMICAAFVVLLSVLLILVVPAFKEVFSSFGAELPALTMLFIFASEWAVRWFWLLLLLAAGATALYRARGGFPQAWLWLGALVQRAPVVGSYLGAAFLLRTGRVLRPVAAGRLAVAPVLAYLRGSVERTTLASQAQQLQSMVLEGLPLPDALRRALPKGGDLALAFEFDRRRPGSGTSLERAMVAAHAELLNQRVRLQQTLVALLYILLGLLVGSFVIAMYLPIFKLGAVV